MVATLLGTLKDVVGYIFTNDKWVNSFLLNIITFLEGVIYIPGAAQKLLTDRVHKPPSGNHVPQRFLPTAQCQWAAWMLLTLGQYCVLWWYPSCTHPLKCHGLGSGFAAG